jgi:RNA polymerase sigma-70 factor (ECF subfamily)
VEPVPDQALGLEDHSASPEARYELRESLELAFVAALQHLPATQRAVLILREVLGFSAREVAESLETSVASVNSALQRARKAVDERVPDRSQQATLRSLGDDRVRELVESYMDAMRRGDVNAVVDMLAEDAAWSMPPLATWYRGREQLTAFLSEGPLSGDWRWRHLPTSANGQAAVAAYAWQAGEGAHLPFALDVLTFEGTQIKEVTAFIARSPQGDDGRVIARWPAHPPDPAKVAALFERFALPSRLD